MKLSIIIKQNSFYLQDFKGVKKPSFERKKKSKFKNRFKNAIDNEFKPRSKDYMNLKK